ncbi:transposase [Streptomyces cavernae]|uniref:transposase n=1 Tax=Streptomyces cavernae TaxID=2259034 RepID=UPI001EE4E47B|nr:transposase [Streptomyces cavernae]
MAAVSPFVPVVGRLGCLRGVSTLTAFGLAVEVGDWHWFTGATIGSYLGLVPSEGSGGERRMQGPITKTATATPAGCWWRRPGTTASGTVWAAS